MQISIVGTGRIGGTLAGLLSSGSHKLILGVRDRNAIAVKEERFPGISAQPALEAMRASDVVVLATPWQAVESLLSQSGSLSGKVLIDTTNPVLADASGLALPGNISAAETIQRWQPAARVVKAFNSLGSGYLGNGQVGGTIADGFYCGDDVEAKSIAASLIEQSGLHPCDVGGLRNARYLEAMAMLWIDMAVHQRRAGRFAFKLLSEPAA